MVVLVDGGTASAGEIVTGALNLTAGRYFTPDGLNLAGDGIGPDVRAADDADTPRDEALRAALETLGRKLPRAG